MKDFSSDIKQFKLADYVFTARAIMPQNAIKQFAKMQGVLSGSNLDDVVDLDKLVDELHMWFDIVLIPDDAKKLREMEVNVILLQNIMQWLIEEYGLRPMESSQDS